VIAYVGSDVYQPRKTKGSSGFKIHESCRQNGGRADKVQWIGRVELVHGDLSNDLTKLLWKKFDKGQVAKAHHSGDLVPSIVSVYRRMSWEKNTVCTKLNMIGNRVKEGLGDWVSKKALDEE
jgi:hypothetical protein